MVFEGCEELLKQSNPSLIPVGFFDYLVRSARVNWSQRGVPRLPSTANWKLRSALRVTKTEGQRFEKQLEKAAAMALQGDGWGNAVPTASGLVDSGGKQMNIDLVHPIANGFGFVELKWKSDDPILAATQMMRYAALYMLYRLEPELNAAFEDHEMLRASAVQFEVLAPYEYYSLSTFDLVAFENRINHELAAFSLAHLPTLKTGFAYRCLPRDFAFTPGMDSKEVRDAVLARCSPFQKIRAHGCHGQPVASLADWQAFGLPKDRSHHWKPGRSACELATSWTRNGLIQVPQELNVLLQSHVETRGLTLNAGYIEHETSLPFSTRGPRCHDLFLTGSTADEMPIVVSIEAKADEPFDVALWKKLAAVEGQRSNLPSRLEWLTQYLFGESAFQDFDARNLKPEYADMFYQVLAAVAALCIEAQRHSAARAILVIHEFHTSLTEDTKMEENGRVLERFLQRLKLRNSYPATTSKTGALLGPIKMRSGSFKSVPFPSQIELFVGKLRTDVAADTLYRH